MNQRMKDVQTGQIAGHINEDTCKAFADGAEYARKELFEWLRAMYGKDERLERLAKEYGL